MGTGWAERSYRRHGGPGRQGQVTAELGDPNLETWDGAVSRRDKARMSLHKGLCCRHTDCAKEHSKIGEKPVNSCRHTL